MVRKLGTYHKKQTDNIYNFLNIYIKMAENTAGSPIKDSTCKYVKLHRTNFEAVYLILKLTCPFLVK
jgi:hypothetical protein